MQALISTHIGHQHNHWRNPRDSETHHPGTSVIRPFAMHGLKRSAAYMNECYEWGLGIWVLLVLSSSYNWRAFWGFADDVKEAVPLSVCTGRTKFLFCVVPLDSYIQFFSDALRRCEHILYIAPLFMQNSSTSNNQMANYLYKILFSYSSFSPQSS